MKGLTIPLLIACILGLSAYWLWAGDESFDFKKNNLKLGLDLIGGAQLEFEAQPTETVTQIKQEVMDGLLKVIETRINSSGTSEANVQQVGSKRILVEIPGVDPELVKRRLLKTAKLEFKELDLKNKTKDKEQGWISTGVTGADLQRASATPDQGGGTNWTILFELKEKGAEKFGVLTERLAKNQLPLGIFLDDKLISAPRVQSQIKANGQITGDFSLETAKDLAVQLNAGALPVPINLISERTVGATLGQDSIYKSLKAAIIGFIIVAIFMISIYRLPGFLATLALLAYTLISLGLFTRGITLTLAGIAGFILSIGMAVDANVLIFERIKEELKQGKSVFSSVEEGFKKAFPSIFDSNLNTLIVCVILGFLGTGLVKGFAITLAIGVIISFFSAIVITHELMKVFLLMPIFRKAFWYGVKEENLNVIKKSN